MWARYCGVMTPSRTGLSRPKMSAACPASVIVRHDGCAHISNHVHETRTCEDTVCSVLRVFVDSTNRRDR